MDGISYTAILEIARGIDGPAAALVSAAVVALWFVREGIRVIVQWDKRRRSVSEYVLALYERAAKLKPTEDDPAFHAIRHGVFDKYGFDVRPETPNAIIYCGFGAALVTVSRYVAASVAPEYKGVIAQQLTIPSFGPLIGFIFYTAVGAIIGRKIVGKSAPKIVCFFSGVLTAFALPFAVLIIGILAAVIYLKVVG
jgi:hypothetical protein